MAEKYQDEGLKGNEKIEEAIAALQKEATPEQLAHTLTVIRHRVQEGGQFIVAVEPSLTQTQMNVRVVKTSVKSKFVCKFIFQLY